MAQKGSTIRYSFTTVEGDVSFGIFTRKGEEQSSVGGAGAVGGGGGGGGEGDEADEVSVT